jgi:PAS domain S-box-containing protein
MKQGATDYVLKERLAPLAPVVERAVKEAREIASRQDAEESLRRAESELRTMLGNLPALAFKGWMDGSASFYDDPVEALTGYPKEVFHRSELTWLDLIHPEDQAKAHEAFRQALEGDRSYVREYRIIVKSGEVVWIQERSHITCTSDRRVDHISGIIIDITGHRATHEALSRSLAESERSRREISSLLKGARAVLEQEDFALTARKIFDSCREITGAVSGYVALLSATGEENEVLFLEDGGLPCTVDPSLPMPIRGLRGEAYHQGQVLYENDFPHSPWQALMPTGHVALRNVMFGPLIIGGQAVGLMGLANKPEDFTPEDARITGAFGEIAAMALKNTRLKQEQEQAERTLREHNHFLQTLLDAIPSPVFYKDVGGRYLGCNAAFEDFWGLRRQELLGKTASDLTSREIATAHDDMDQSLLRHGGVQIFEHQVRSVNQAPKDVIFYKSTFGNQDGTVGGAGGGNSGHQRPQTGRGRPGEGPGREAGDPGQYPRHGLAQGQRGPPDRSQ